MASLATLFSFLSLLFPLLTCSSASSASQTPLNLLCRRCPSRAQPCLGVYNYAAMCTYVLGRGKWFRDWPRTQHGARNASTLGVLLPHLHPYYLNRCLYPSVYCMLQRAPAEQKALTYKKEGACFKATVCILPEHTLQSASHFRGNGCISLIGKVPNLALVGFPLTQHGVGGTAISLLTESKGH